MQKIKKLNILKAIVFSFLVDIFAISF